MQTDDVNFETTIPVTAPDHLDVTTVGFVKEGTGVAVQSNSKTLFTFPTTGAALGFAHSLTLFLGEPIAGRVQVNELMHTYDVIFGNEEPDGDD